MGKMISLSVRYPDETLQTILLLKRLLTSNLNEYVRPKMGMININGEIFKFGVPNPGGNILEGEHRIVPGMTALPGYSDATRSILDFLDHFPSAFSGSVEFFGETLLEYALGGTVKKRMGFPLWAGRRTSEYRVIPNQPIPSDYIFNSKSSLPLVFPQRLVAGQ